MLPYEYFTMPYCLTAKDGEMPQNAEFFISVPLASIMALALGLMIILATEPEVASSEEPNPVVESAETH